MKSTTNSTKTSYSQMQPSDQLEGQLDGVASNLTSVFVGGIPPRCTQDQLTKFMSQFGYVKEVYISKHRKYPGHKGFAFANFSQVTKPSELFGKHAWKGQLTEVKRSLQNYIQLQDLPAEATRADVLSAFSQKGFQVWEILMGGVDPGVPPGVAGVRLSQFYHQEQVSAMGYIEILKQPVRVGLHIPKNQFMPPKPKSVKDLPQLIKPKRFNSQVSEESQQPPRISNSSEDLLSAHTSGNGAQTEGRDIRSSLSGISRVSANQEGEEKIKTANNFDQKPTHSQQQVLRAVPVPIQTVNWVSHRPTAGLGMAPAADWNRVGPSACKREIYIGFYAFPGHL